ncbi:hypothetical protein D3C79_830630 [compost metagenome]
MTWPVNGQRAQYNTSDAQMKANGAMTGMPFKRRGRLTSAACTRKDITLTGPVKNEMITATEITAASVPHPRKKNRKTKLTARFSHIA